MQSQANVPPFPFHLRVVRLTAWTLLALASVPLTALLLMWAIPTLGQAALGGVFAVESEFPRKVDWILACVLVPPVGLMAVGWRLKFRLGSGVAAGMAVTLALYVTLMWDDSRLVHPLTYSELSPPLLGDAERYAVLMRYSGERPLKREFKEPTHLARVPLPGRSGAPTTVDEWRTWVQQNGDAARADWELLCPVREWLMEMDAWPTLPDLTEGFQPELLAFGPLQTVGLRAAALSRVLALEGRAEEAADVILPILRFSRKLEPLSRTMVRCMVARVLQRRMIVEIEFILDQSPLSPLKRKAIHEALSLGVEPAVGIRQMLTAEYVYALNQLVTMDGSKDETFESFRPWLQPRALFYQPRRSLNLYWELVQTAQDFLSHRRPGDFEETINLAVERHATPRIKNLAGQWICVAAQPAFGKVGASFWEIEDQRIALLHRLKTLETASGSPRTISPADRLVSNGSSP
jgi:hypothetical protein